MKETEMLPKEGDTLQQRNIVGRRQTQKEPIFYSASCLGIQQQDVSVDIGDTQSQQLSGNPLDVSGHKNSRTNIVMGHKYSFGGDTSFVLDPKPQVNVL